MEKLPDGSCMEAGLAELHPEPGFGCRVLSSVSCGAAGVLSPLPQGCGCDLRPPFSEEDSLANGWGFRYEQVWEGFLGLPPQQLVTTEDLADGPKFCSAWGRAFSGAHMGSPGTKVGSRASGATGHLCG